MESSSKPFFEKEAIVRDDRIPYFYVSSVNISASPYDVVMVCKNTVPSDNNLYERHVCDIFMSPQHAKALYGLLDQVIRNYENEFGTIRIPKNKSKDQEKKDDDR